MMKISIFLNDLRVFLRGFLVVFAFLLRMVQIYGQENLSVLQYSNIEMLTLRETFILYSYYVARICLALNLIDLFYQIIVDWRNKSFSHSIIVDFLTAIGWGVFGFFLLPGLFHLNFIYLVPHLFEWFVLTTIDLKGSFPIDIFNKMTPDEIKNSGGKLPDMNQHSVVAGTTEDGRSYVCAHIKKLLEKTAPEDWKAKLAVGSTQTALNVFGFDDIWCIGLKKGEKPGT